MVVNDDAVTLERTRHLQVQHQQAGSHKGGMHLRLCCKREPLANLGVAYQVNRYRVVVLNLSK